MEPTRVRKRSQERPVENARTPMPYAQIPLCLLTLPTGERAAAIEVWAALHHHLRLGSKPERITDEELAECPSLEGRSRRHRSNGLDTLVRTSLIAREAGGSSRTLAIVGKLGTRAHRESTRPSAPLRADPRPSAPVRAEDIEEARRWFPTLCAKLHATVHEDAH
jgi:hypothetical protein